MNVVLVVPPATSAGVALSSLAGAEHLGVAYLAAALRKAGHEVGIVNADVALYVGVQTGRLVTPDLDAAIRLCKEEILSHSPDFIGFSVTGPSLEPALALARWVKERKPDIHVSFGGHQATATARDLMRNEPVIDSIGIGECDETILPVVHRLESAISLSGVSGFLYRDGNGIAGGPPPRPGKALYALEKLGFPARDDLQRISALTGLKEARLSTSRGCQDHCTFCADATQHSFRRYQMRPPKAVIDEIEQLNREFGIEHFWLVDDNFATRDPESQNRAKLIADLLLERRLGVTCRAYFRPDAFHGAPDLTEHLFDAGIVTALIGVESGSPRRLKYLGKRAQIADIRQTADAMHHVGMGLQIGFIMFDPLTSFADIRQDVQLLDEMGELYVIFNVVQNMDVYPGTSYRRLLEVRGLSDFDHPYLGGFRKYRYADPRIASLAAALESRYTPALMASDNAIWRVKLFLIPKLIWMRRWNRLNAADADRIDPLRDRLAGVCTALSGLHRDFLNRAIEWAEAECLDEAIDPAFQDLVLRRSPHLDAIRDMNLVAAGILSRCAPFDQTGKPTP